MDQSSKTPTENNIDYCRTRTVLRAVLVSLWLSLCFSLFAANSLQGFWQQFTQTSLFLLWSALLVVLLLCLLRGVLARLGGRRIVLEIGLALLIVVVNSVIALSLTAAYFPSLQTPAWFLLRNLILGLFMLPWLLRLPWLMGAGSIPMLDDEAKLLNPSPSEEPGNEDELLIKSHGNLLRINLREVRYFYADNKYVTARGAEQEYIVDQSLRQLEERFGKHVFRVHRGYLLVTAFIRGVQNDALGRTEVMVQDLEERVPVSRRYAPALRQFLKDLVARQ